MGDIGAEDLLGPLGSLVLSLVFCFMFLRRFQRVTERLFRVFETELEICHHRCNFLLTELLKIKFKDTQSEKE